MFFNLVIRWSFDVPRYFIDSSKSIEVFFVRINSNKLTTKFLSYLFLFHSQYFCQYDHHQLLLQVYSYENVNKYYKPKHYFVFSPCLFSPSNELIICASTDCSFVKIISYCSNPNLVLNLCANVVLQYIITLVDNLSLKSLLGLLFLVHQLVYIYGFMVSKKFYCNFLNIFMI